MVAHALRSVLGLNGLSGRLDRIDGQFEKFDLLSSRLDRIDAQREGFKDLATRLDQLDGDVAGFNAALGKALFAAQGGTVSMSLPGGIRYSLSVDAADRDVFHAAVASAGLQDATWQLLMRWLRPDDVFMDLGANIGTISIPAAVLGAKVYAFEMLGENVAHLVRAAKSNRLENLAIVQAAVSDEAGMVGAGGDSAWGSVVSDAMVSVPAITLDDYVEHNAIRRIDLLKIDVEGSEGRVLAGAARLIGRHHPDIVIESNALTCGNAGYSYRSLLQQLRGFGYTLYRIHGDHLCPWAETAVQEMVYADYLATIREPADIAARSGCAILPFTDAEAVAGILSAGDYDKMWRLHVLAVAGQLPASIRMDKAVQAALEKWAWLTADPAFAVLQKGSA